MKSLGHFVVSHYQQYDSLFNGLFRLFKKEQAPMLHITTSTFESSHKSPMLSQAFRAKHNTVYLIV